MSIETMRLRYIDKLRLISRDARLTIVSWMFWAFGFGINDVIFNLYLIEAGFGEDFLGFFLSISMFLSGALAIPAGMIADRYSRKRILLFGNILLFVGIFIQYSTLSPISLLFSQFLYGIGFGFNGVAWQPYTVSVSTEEERVHVFSVRFAFFLVANLLGSLIGGFLPSFWTSFGFTMNLLTAYRFSLWTALIPLAFSVLTIIPMTVDRPERKPEKRRSRIDFGNIRNRGFIGKYALAWTVSGLGAGMFVHFFNVFFNRAFSVDVTVIGIIFAINTVVMAAGNFASPWIVDRFGKLATAIWFQVFSIPFLLLLSWSPILSIAIFGFVGRALFMNIAWPVMEVFYMEGLEKEEQSTAMGVVNAGDSLSLAIGLNIAGWMLASGFLRAPYLLAALIYSLSIVMFYWFFGTNDLESASSEE